MRIISVRQARPGMKLGEPVLGHGGRVLLARGIGLTEDYLGRLAELRVPAVYVEDADTADVRPPQAIREEFRGKLLREMTDAFESIARLGSVVRRKWLEGLAAPPPAGDEDDDAAAAAAAADLAPASPEGAHALHALAANADELLDQLSSAEVLLGLNSIKSHDNYTFQHSIDVAVMGVVLARAAGWDRPRVRAFAVGCLLHDLGKIFVRPEVLTKPGRLTADEFEEMKAHPTVGYRVVKALAPGLGALVPQVAYQHHERQDGSGYPRGLRGGNTLGRWGQEGSPNRIHDFGSLSAVSDVYDALTSDRPYRESHTPDRVVDAIDRMSGSHLNREAVAVFRRVVAPFPVCAEVRVTAGPRRGYRGVVVAVRKDDLARPLVRLLFDEAGNRVDPVQVDLAVDRDVQIEGARGENRPVDRITAARQTRHQPTSGPSTAEIARLVAGATGGTLAAAR